MNGPKAETGDFNLNDPEQVEKLRHLLEEEQGAVRSASRNRRISSSCTGPRPVEPGRLSRPHVHPEQGRLETDARRPAEPRKPDPQGLDDAEQARKETADLRSKLQAEMDSANAKVRQMIEEGRRDAQRIADETLARAKAEIQGERDRGRREIETARDRRSRKSGTGRPAWRRRFPPGPSAGS